MRSNSSASSHSAQNIIPYPSANAVNPVINFPSCSPNLQYNYSSNVNMYGRQPFNHFSQPKPQFGSSNIYPNLAAFQINLNNSPSNFNQQLTPNSSSYPQLATLGQTNLIPTNTFPTNLSTSASSNTLESELNTDIINNGFTSISKSKSADLNISQDVKITSQKLEVLHKSLKEKGAHLPHLSVPKSISDNIIPPNQKVNLSDLIQLVIY